MGLGMFSRGSTAPERVTQTDQRPLDASPYRGTTLRPIVPGNEKFSQVITEFEGKYYTLAIMHYPAVTKYNGAKLVVYSTPTWKTLDKERIDPHFYPDDKGPIARFAPDEQGLTMAFKMAVTEEDLKGESRTTAYKLLASTLKNLQGK